MISYILNENSCYRPGLQVPVNGKTKIILILRKWCSGSKVPCNMSQRGTSLLTPGRFSLKDSDCYQYAQLINLDRILMFVLSQMLELFFKNS